MKREQVRAMMPILQAFVDGKEIEGRPKGFSNDFEGWVSVDEISGLDSIEYRIKPEIKFRPFKNAEECWAEMKKHQPFGWVKDKKDGHRALITAVDDDTCGMSLNGNAAWSLSAIMDLFTFADGTPFGVKTEE